MRLRLPRLVRRERRLRAFDRRNPSLSALAARPRHMQAARGESVPVPARLARRARKLARDCWYGATTAFAALALLVALHSLTTPDVDLEPYPLQREESTP